MIEQIQIIIADSTLTDAEKIASIRSILVEEKPADLVAAVSREIGTFILMASHLDKERRGYMN